MENKNPIIFMAGLGIYHDGVKYLLYYYEELKSVHNSMQEAVERLVQIMTQKACSMGAYFENGRWQSIRK